MKCKSVVAALRCLALVAVVALAAAPVASAEAEFDEFSGTESYAPGYPQPTTPAPRVTGSVAHWTFENVLLIESASPYLKGENHTHLVVLFDPVTGAGTCHGTFQIVLQGEYGVWEGTFAGTINLYSGEWDVHTTGIGVSGRVAGMISRGRDVNGEVTGIVIAPHGF
jgi:hypothetical protein